MWINSVLLGAPAFVDLKSTSRAMNSVPPYKSVDVPAKCGPLKVAPETILLPIFATGDFD